MRKTKFQFQNYEVLVKQRKTAVLMLMCAETEDASVLRIIDRMPAIQLALQVNIRIRQKL